MAYAGYQTRQVKVNNNDSLKIELSPAGNSLSEVVVIGYGAQKRQDVTGSVSTINPGNIKVDKAAHPIIGWDAYHKYLQQNTAITGGKTGNVKLAFTIDGKGTLSNIRVVKSNNNELNQRAINLVVNGPKWIGAINGKAKEMRLKIKFGK